MTWSHFLEIIIISDELKRDFYATLFMKEQWSVRILRERKNSMLYERTAISKKPEETIANELKELREKDKMSVDLIYRDPYIHNFLGLRDTFSERDLESAILSELEKFILEMGNDFAFLARQKRIVYEKAEGAETPIALILCAEKSQETIELLEMDQGNIHVGQYLTQMPPKELLEEKLHLAFENAKMILEQRNLLENS